jgi:hypothetical protein
MIQWVREDFVAPFIAIIDSDLVKFEPDEQE